MCLPGFMCIAAPWMPPCRPLCPGHSTRGRVCFACELNSPPLLCLPQALELLNHLLFGPPPPADHNYHNHQPQAPAAPAPSAGPTAASATSTPPAFPHWLVPPPGHGLGLQGDDGDYYNPANSLLHDALLPTQPPQQPQLQVTHTPQPASPAGGPAASVQTDAPAGPLDAPLPPTSSVVGGSGSAGISVAEGAAGGGSTRAGAEAASGEALVEPAAELWPRPRLRGIPITLGLIHAAVGRRAGAGRIDMMGTPMRVVNRWAGGVGWGMVGVGAGVGGSGRYVV